MKNVIYLVGQISPKKIETYKWRERVKKEFEDFPDFEIIDPCANFFNQGLISEENIKWKSYYVSENINILSPKDKMYVKKSDIAIANMIQYDEEKPLIGSFFELAWYNSYTDKTVVGVYNDSDSILYKHPFIQNSVTTWVNSVEEACGVVKFYFGVR